MQIDYIHGYVCGYSWWIIVKPIEFLGKMITDHDPIFSRNTSIKRGSWSGLFFQESTKKGFYLLWLSFLIHNFSPDHAKIDLDHAQNDPDLLVGQIKYSQFLPQTIH